MSRPIVEAPLIQPASSLSGETVSDNTIRLPSLWRHSVS